MTNSDLSQNLVGIAIGVRFSQNFAIADNLGKITDYLLYSRKNTLFNSDFFPLVESDTNHRYLRDHENTKYLAITTSDIIFEVNDLAKNQVTAADMENAYEAMILSGVFGLYEVREIQRIGYLTKFRLNNKALADSFLRKTGVDTNNISLRFQKNYPMPDSMTKKEVNDYCSNIFTINKRPDSDQLFIRSDYQVYFKPPLDDKDDIRFRDFIREREKFNNTELLKWLNDYLSNG